MFAPIIAIQVHLPDVGVGEWPDFEVNDDKAPQSAVEQQQIHAIPFVTNPQTPLPSDERKVVSQFQQELFQMKNKRLLQVILRVFILQSEKFQEERVPNFLIGRNLVGGQAALPLGQHPGFVR